MIAEGFTKITKWLEDRNIRLKYLDTVKSTGATKLKVAHGRKEYLLNPVNGELELGICTDAPNKTFEFGTVPALTDYLKERVTGDDIANCIILIDSDGVRVVMDELAPERRDVLHIPFFNADLPSTEWMDFDRLLLYLDQNEGKIEKEDKVRLALKELRLVEGSTITIKDRGASTSVETHKNEEIQNGNTTEIPKYISITLRIGTREHEALHKFRLRIDTDTGGKDLIFKLDRINRDKAYETFFVKCLADIRAALTDKWQIFEGPLTK